MSRGLLKIQLWIFHAESLFQCLFLSVWLNNSKQAPLESHLHTACVSFLRLACMCTLALYTKTRRFDGHRCYRMNRSTEVWVSLPPHWAFKDTYPGKRFQVWCVGSPPASHPVKPCCKGKTTSFLRIFLYLQQFQKGKSSILWAPGIHFHQSSVSPWKDPYLNNKTSIRLGLSHMPGTWLAIKQPSELSNPSHPPSQDKWHILVRITYFTFLLPQCCHRAALNWFN